MNERIRELATEVGISVEYLTNTKQWTLIEALAELIVKECAKVAEQWYSDYPKDDRLVSECIMETFGVKNDND